ncbi:MAG: DUF5615 family PIN-like protein [Pyrinomonadaceae bacterium]|nr:DUF5615 family PIN-like protein [Pyrinomonadaceae bacterium]
MLKFVADEDFNNRIVRGIRRLSSEIDIVRVHEVGLLGQHDTRVLEWAANENRIVLTHDAATMIGFGYERIRDGHEFPGMIAVSQYASIGRVIEDIAEIADSETSGLRDQVAYIPFKK